MKNKKRRAALRLVPLLSAAPAVIMGCAAMYLHGVSPSVYLQNIAALAVGGIAAFIHLSAPHPASRKFMYAAMFLSIAGLCCTLISRGTDGIHRWVYLGPIALHAAFIVLPVALIGIDRLWADEKRVAALILIPLIAGILFCQPDASMVAAFALAMIPTALLRPKPGAAQKGILCLLLVLATLSFIKGGTLEPVDYTEGILHMARQCGLAVWFLSVASLPILFCPFAIGAIDKTARPLCMGCSLFYLALLLSSATGAFPVPIIGYGVSPIAGYMILAAHAVGRCLSRTAWDAH